jgi:hypothetical protein
VVLEEFGAATKGACGAASHLFTGCIVIEEKSHDGAPLEGATDSCPSTRGVTCFPIGHCKGRNALTLCNGLAATPVETSDADIGLWIRPTRCIR